MKRFFPVLGLMLLGLFHQGCGPAATPAAPGGSAAVNHNYPLLRTFGSTGTGNGQFTDANGIAVYKGAIFVTDYSNNRLEKFDLSGNFLGSTQGNPAQHFSGPYGMAIDSTGVLYVAETGHDLVQKLDRNLNYISSFGSLGTALGQFTNPTGVAVDSTDRVYVTETGNNRVQRCDNAGGSCVTVGGTSPGAGNGQFSGPTGVSVDKSGNVWVCDRGNLRIQELNSSLGFVQTWGSVGTGNGLFTTPWDVRVDQDGNVIVADYSSAGTTGSVQKYTPAGVFIQQIGTGWSGPEYTAFDSSNNLYVTEWTNNTVTIFTPN